MSWPGGAVKDWSNHGPIACVYWATQVFRVLCEWRGGTPEYGSRLINPSMQLMREEEVELPRPPVSASSRPSGISTLFLREGEFTLGLGCISEGLF